MRFLVIPPSGSRPTLVVDTQTTVDAAAINRLRDTLHGLGCPNGIVFDERSCVILRDTYTSMDSSSIVEDGRFDTVDVLGRVAGGAPRTLEERVEAWLDALTSDWNLALSEKPEVAAGFIADIVPAASGSEVHPVGSGLG